MFRLAVLLLLSAPACAEIWFNTDAYSYHFDRNWRWNEEHNLINLEYVTPSYSVSVSTFKNSFNATSNSVQFRKRLWSKGRLAFEVSIAMATGYEERYYGDGQPDKVVPLAAGLTLIPSQSITFADGDLKVGVHILGESSVLITFGVRLF